MQYMQTDLYKRMEDGRRAEMQRDATIWRLLRQRGRRPRHWLARQRCWLLCQVGRWMVRLGQELQRASVHRLG